MYLYIYVYISCKSFSPGSYCSFYHKALRISVTEAEDLKKTECLLRKKHTNEPFQS